MNTSGPTPRATLRLAVGAAISAISVAVALTFNISGPIMAAWSGVAVALWGLAEAVYDARATAK